MEELKSEELSILVLIKQGNNNELLKTFALAFDIFSPTSK